MQPDTRKGNFFVIIAENKRNNYAASDFEVRGFKNHCYL